MSWHFSIDLAKENKRKSAGFPLSSALSDADRNLQEAHLESERRGSTSQRGLIDAIQHSIRDQMGEDFDAIKGIDEEEMALLLGRASTLVMEATQHLHAMLRRQALLEDVARHVILQAADEAVVGALQKSRLKQEWRIREHWVKAEAFEKRGPKKGKNRVRAAAPRSKKEVCSKLSRVTEQIDRRSRMYANTAASVSCLEDTGFLQTRCLTEASILKERQGLAMTDGAESLFLGEIIEIVLPSTAHHFGKQGTSKSAGPTIIGRHSLFPTTAAAAASQRDAEFAIAHFNENSLKLGMEMSVADVSLRSVAGSGAEANT